MVGGRGGTRADEEEEIGYEGGNRMEEEDGKVTGGEVKVNLSLFFTGGGGGGGDE